MLHLLNKDCYFPLWHPTSQQNLSAGSFTATKNLTDEGVNPLCSGDAIFLQIIPPPPPSGGFHQTFGIPPSAFDSCKDLQVIGSTPSTVAPEPNVYGGAEQYCLCAAVFAQIGF